MARDRRLETGLLGELGGLSYLLALVSVHLFFASYAMSIVAVPQSISDQPDWLVGLVVGALGIAGMVTRPLVGVWVDSGNRQRWLRLGATGTVIAFVGYAISPTPWVTIGFRFIHGIAMGLFTTALLAVVSGMLAERRRGLGMGVYQSVNAGAQMYASPLAVGIAAAVSFEVAFLVGAAFATGALVFGLTVRDPDAETVGRVRKPWRERSWISRPALMPALVFLSVTTTVGAVQAFLPLFAEERDLGNVGLFYTVWGLALLVFRAGGGGLSDRFGRAQVVLPSLVLVSISLFLLANTHSQAMLLATAVLYGSAFAAVQVTVVALVVDRAPVEGRGAGAATYTMAWDVGAVLGGIVLGLLIDRTSYALGFAICGLLPLLGIVLYASRIGLRPQQQWAIDSVAAGDTGGS
ncbi:MAG: MFS transporter [Dehalococcoidia bacterium]